MKEVKKLCILDNNDDEILTIVFDSEDKTLKIIDASENEIEIDDFDEDLQEQMVKSLASLDLNEYEDDDEMDEDDEDEDEDEEGNDDEDEDDDYCCKPKKKK